MRKNLTQSSLQKKLQEKTEQDAAAASRIMSEASERLNASMTSRLSGLHTMLDGLSARLEDLTDQLQHLNRASFWSRWTPAIVATAICMSTCATLWVWMLWQQAETQKLATQTAVETMRRFGTVEKDSQGHQFLKIPLATNRRQ